MRIIIKKIKKMIPSLYFNVVSSFSYFQTLPNIDYENNIKIVIFIIIIISQFTCYALYTIIFKSEKSFIITIMNY